MIFKGVKIMGIKTLLGFLNTTKTTKNTFFIFENVTIGNFVPITNFFRTLFQIGFEVIRIIPTYFNNVIKVMSIKPTS